MLFRHRHNLRIAALRLGVCFVLLYCGTDHRVFCLAQDVVPLRHKITLLGTPGILNVVISGGNDSSFTGRRGFDMQWNGANTTITFYALGRYNNAGDSHAHIIHLYTNGVQIAQATVTCSGNTGSFDYVSISPVRILAVSGTKIQCESEETAGIDHELACANNMYDIGAGILATQCVGSNNESDAVCASGHHTIGGPPNFRYSIP